MFLFLPLSLPLSLHSLHFLTSFVLSFPAQFPNKQIIGGRAPKPACGAWGGNREQVKVLATKLGGSVRPFVYLISNPICFRSQATSTLGRRKHTSSPERRGGATDTGLAPCGSASLASAKAGAANVRKGPTGNCRRGGRLSDGNTWRGGRL